MPGSAEDALFKALADETRRTVLDALRESGPLTLGQLCARVSMTRQAVTQHVDVLVKAGVVVVVRRGRERWHYLNAAAIHEIAARWIGQFDQPHVTAITVIKQLTEESPMNDRSIEAPEGQLPEYVYVTYIKASAEKVWEAITDPRVTALYWNGMANTSTWQEGAPWTHQTRDGDGHYDIWGSVVIAEPPSRLAFTFQPAAHPLEQPGSLVTFLIEPDADGTAVRLTVTHENLPDADTRLGISRGWPVVLASLKSYLETGEPLDEASWALMAH